MLGHNLEKNLRKIEGFREKGELEKALRQLQDWARKHPDTPHYLFETAMVAFDLRDYGVGVSSLKQLLRAVPNAEDKVLSACGERFNEDPALPLCEFLVEHYVSHSRHGEAFEAANRLGAAELAVYRKKVGQRNQGLDPDALDQSGHLSQGLFTMLAIGNASGDGVLFDESAGLLQRCDKKAAKKLLPLCELALERNSGDSHIQFAKGRALCATLQVAEGAHELAEAAATTPELVPMGLEILAGAKPEKDELGAHHFALGRLHLIAGAGAAAADHLWQAADLAPEMREELVRHLERSPDPDNADDLTAVLKLHLRLLVVQSEFDRAKPILDRLRDEELCSASELRGLLGDRATKTEAKSSELMALLAENALASGELRAVAEHLNSIPDSDTDTLRKLLNLLRTAAADKNGEQRLEWLALQAILESRVHDDVAANNTLIDLWRDDSLDEHQVFVVTCSCLENLVPTPALLVALLPYALTHDELDTATQQFESLLRHGDGDEEQLVSALLSFIEMESEHSGAFLRLIDSLDRGLGATQLLRYPVALAALSAGDFDRAVPEFAMLLMGASDEREEVLDHVRDIVRDDADNARLQLAAYRIFQEEGEREEAARHLGHSLRLDPSRIGELSQNFEELLRENSSDHELWSNYASALFDARRFAQLDEICRRAAEQLPPDASAEFRLLQAHMLVETGKLSEGLTILAAQTQSPGFDQKRAVVILRAITEGNPAHGHAHLILGDMLVQLGEIDDAIDSFGRAAEADDTLLRSLVVKMREIATSPSSEGAHLLATGRFFRRAGQIPAAAESYDRALELDEGLAEALLGELLPELEKTDVHAGLLLLGAKAARMSGQLERACDLLGLLNERDDSRFEGVLAEYRRLQEDFPTELLPIHYVARVLYERGAAQAANQILLDTATNDAYDLAARTSMVEEFRSRRPDDGRIVISLATLYARAERVDDVVTTLRSGCELEDFDSTRGVEIARQTQEAHPFHADLGFILHDLLQRCGSVDEALRAIPEPGTVDASRQAEISERFVPYSRQVLGDAELAPRYAESLHRQGRTDDCLTALRTAAERVDDEVGQALWTQLAQRLHEDGQAQESRRVLENLSQSTSSRRHFYQVFDEWNRERLESEGRALQERCAQFTTADPVLLELSANLLERGLPRDAIDALAVQFEDQDDRARRACLVARAELELHHAEAAQGVLLACAGEYDDELGEEIEFLLADCAGQLGRWGESHARYLELIESQTFGPRARTRAKDAYRRYLDDSAGNYRAVLSKVSDLKDESGNPQEKS